LEQRRIRTANANIVFRFPAIAPRKIGGTAHSSRIPYFASVLCLAVCVTPSAESAPSTDHGTMYAVMLLAMAFPTMG